MKVCDKNGVRRLREEELEKVGVQTQLDRCCSGREVRRRGRREWRGRRMQLLRLLRKCECAMDFGVATNTITPFC